MSSHIHRLEGFDQLNYIVNRRCPVDVEHAIDVMIRHEQDMSFLINKIMDIWVDRHMKQRNTK